MIGSITLGDISLTSSAIPAKYFKTLRIKALLAPSNELVLPVTITPSSSSIAAAGASVSKALLLAALTTFLSAIEIDDFSIRS